LKRGERAAIGEPNRCGKSTLLRILLGLERPDAGEALTGGRLRLGCYSMRRTARIVRVAAGPPTMRMAR